MQTRRYLVELGLAMAGYAVLLVTSIFAFHTFHPQGLLRYATLLLPMLGVAAVAVAVLRQLWRMDELQRRIQFDAIAIAFLGTAVVTLGWGFVQLGGAPAMHPFAVWPIMAVFWIAGGFVARARYR